METWKEVKGFEGIYEVSNFGSIKSVSRISFNGKGSRLVRERILKPQINSSGYLHVTLSKGGKKTTKTIHQLVSIAFLNHNPCKQELVINHKDFNRLNNNVSNLEIVSTRENTSLCHKKSSSKYVGVSWNKRANKWTSSINYNGKKHHLGYFTNELEASNKYQEFLKRINN